MSWYIQCKTDLSLALAFQKQGAKLGSNSCVSKTVFLNFYSEIIPNFRFLCKYSKLGKNLFSLFKKSKWGCLHLSYVFLILCNQEKKLVLGDWLVSDDCYRRMFLWVDWKGGDGSIWPCRYLFTCQGEWFLLLAWVFMLLSTLMRWVRGVSHKECLKERHKIIVLQISGDH